MKAYVHSHHIRPNGTMDSLLTVQVRWRHAPTGELQVHWGRWRPVHTQTFTTSTSPVPLFRYFLRLRRGSGEQASITFTED